MCCIYLYLFVVMRVQLYFSVTWVVFVCIYLYLFVFMRVQLYFTVTWVVFVCIYLYLFVFMCVYLHFSVFPVCIFLYLFVFMCVYLYFLYFRFVFSCCIFEVSHQRGMSIALVIPKADRRQRVQQQQLQMQFGGFCESEYAGTMGSEQIPSPYRVYIGNFR